jgi:hypothetical protein
MMVTAISAYCLDPFFHLELQRGDYLILFSSLLTGIFYKEKISPQHYLVTQRMSSYRRQDKPDYFPLFISFQNTKLVHLHPSTVTTYIFKSYYELTGFKSNYNMLIRKDRRKKTILSPKVVGIYNPFIYNPF